MVGPFMQGVLLMGIIYWYSKGLINMINDYYRGEFNRKLKNEIIDQNFGNPSPVAYDLDDMEQLLNIETNREFATANQHEDILTFKRDNLDLNSSNSCYRLNSKKEFLNILFTIIYNYYKLHPLINPICWINENKNNSFSQIV